MEEKKIINYTIRVEKDLKDRFLQVCKSNDSDSSKEIRKFMKEYLRKNAQTSIKF